MRAAYKLIKNATSKDSQDYMQTVVPGFKLLFYASITFGIAWNLAYFWLVVGALPDFGSDNLITYVLAIFGMGFLSIIFIALIYIAPGLAFYYICTAKNKPIEKKFSVFELYFLSSLTINVSLFFENLSRLPAVVASIVIISAFVFFIFKESREMPIGKFIKNFSSEQQLKNCLYSLTQGFKSDWRFLAGCLVSVFLFFSFSVMFFLGVVASMEASGQDKSKVIFAFEAALFFASAINFGVATEGFDFAKDFKNRVLNYIISFSVIILSLIFLLSVYFNVAKNLLALPYNMFKIGSYNADITLDGNYIEKSQQLRDIGLSAVHNEACFKVFSSMGAEYIVKHLSNDKCTNTNAKKSHSEKDDSKEEISKQKVKYILRIPKSQVILIGYIDSKR